MAGPINLLFEGERNNVARAIKSLHNHFDSRCIDQPKLAPFKLKRIIKEQFEAEARKRSLLLNMERLPDGKYRATIEGGTKSQGQEGTNRREERTLETRLRDKQRRHLHIWSSNNMRVPESRCLKFVM